VLPNCPIRGEYNTFVAQQNKEAQIRGLFTPLFRAWGRQHWWPAESRFEVIVGAFLTQNTAWTNVELAMAKLRAANILSQDGVRRTALADLERLIRSAGYFRRKAQRLKTFVAHVDEKYQGSLERMFARPTAELRAELLALNGIGPETADSILLYAGNHEVFVVDAYTRRILDRHGILPESAKYEDIRALFERALTSEFATNVAQQLTVEADAGKQRSSTYHARSAMSEERRSHRAQLFNEMHGLIVRVAKNYCQSGRVLCEECPLKVTLGKSVILKIQAKKVRVPA
jgi:endonuclease-3 related protein